MRRVFSVCGILTLGLLAAPALAADTIDDVLKKLEDASNSAKSYTMHTKLTIDNEQNGTKSKVNSEGNTEWKRGEGKKFFSRSDAKATSEMSGPNFSNKDASTTLNVMDGEYSWTLVEYTDGPNKGTKNASKMKIKYDAVEPFKAMKETMDLKLLPDEKVDGQDCFVIESRAKGSTDDARNVTCYRKDCGIGIKVVGYQGGKQSYIMVSTDIKLNPSIPDDHFKFKAPDGVEVQDIDKLMAQPGAASGEGDKKADEPKEQPKEQPKEEPKKEEPKKEEPKKKPGLPKPRIP